MSDTNAQEPTMEEILASIRRIISEDEPPAPSAETQSATPPHGDVHEDILELTERVDEGDAQAPEPEADEPLEYETSGDLDIYTRSAAPPQPQSQPLFTEEEDDSLVSGPAAQTASSAFGQLARSVSMPAEGRTLEDVTRELLRPLLKDWLDRNLPGIVEAAVQAEVERIARQQRR